ncbi:hypothetical protein LCGC14_2264950, partial [marine sediment metagenome]
MPIPRPHDDETEKDFIARCMGDDTMNTEYPDNAQRSGVCHSQWDNKESKEARMLSDKEKQSMLLAALIKEYGMQAEDPRPKSLKIEEVFADRVIYNVDGQLYESPFSMVDDEPKFGDATKVTSTKIFTKEALSMENRRTLLDAALTSHLSLGEGDWVWIEDFSETDVVYNRDRQSYRTSYTLAEDGVVTFGDTEKVTRQITYKAKESLQETYSEIIQEAGKRNALKDAARVKKILELCQELLSSEDADEKKVGNAAKEAVKVLNWIKSLEAEKTEDGAQFPASAFAYAPEADKPSVWK